MPTDLGEVGATDTDDARTLWALWCVRALWIVGTCACLLASDLPFVGVEPLQRIAHYGKLRAEVATSPPSGPFQRLQGLLARLSLRPRAVWVAYYAVGAAINAACLLVEPCALLSLLMVHLVRRIYETLYVTRFSASRREHPLTVCVGTFFYVMLSPTLALEGRLARLRSGVARCARAEGLKGS